MASTYSSEQLPTGKPLSFSHNSHKIQCTHSFLPQSSLTNITFPSQISTEEMLTCKRLLEDILMICNIQVHSYFVSLLVLILSPGNCCQ